MSGAFYRIFIKPRADRPADTLSGFRYGFFLRTGQSDFIRIHDDWIIEKPIESHSLPQ